MKRDLRHYAEQTTFRLIVGGIILFFIIGVGLIYLIYGASAAAMGLVCLGAGILPVVIVLIVFAVMEWIVKSANKN